MFPMDIGKEIGVPHQAQEQDLVGMLKVCCSDILFTEVTLWNYLYQQLQLYKWDVLPFTFASNVTRQSEIFSLKKYLLNILVKPPF